MITLNLLPRTSSIWLSLFRSLPEVTGIQDFQTQYYYFYLYINYYRSIRPGCKYSLMAKFGVLTFLSRCIWFILKTYIYLQIFHFQAHICLRLMRSLAINFCNAENGYRHDTDSADGRRWFVNRIGPGHTALVCLFCF